MIDLKARKKVAPILQPIARALAKIGVTPTMVTVLGLAITIAGAVMIANGLLWQGGFTAGFGVLLDALDGPLARLKGTASDRGAFIDTMSDRFGEIAFWIGLGVYLRDDSMALILCLVALAFSRETRIVCSVPSFLLLRIVVFSPSVVLSIIGWSRSSKISIHICSVLSNLA